MNINKAFGVVVKQICEEKNIKILTLSEKTKISRSTLYKIFEGEQSPTLDTVSLIAEVLSVSPGKLVSKANQLLK